MDNTVSVVKAILELASVKALSACLITFSSAKDLSCWNYT
jgi:hypothetical protein